MPELEVPRYPAIKPIAAFLQPYSCLILSSTGVGRFMLPPLVLCWVGIPLLRFHLHPSQCRSIGQIIGLTAYRRLAHEKHHNQQFLSSLERRRGDIRPEPVQASPETRSPGDHDLLQPSSESSSCRRCGSFSRVEGRLGSMRIVL
jgi:hypothetical protein